MEANYIDADTNWDRAQRDKNSDSPRKEATEAGSHRASGASNWKCPLSEYQKFQSNVGENSNLPGSQRRFIVVLHDQNQLGGDDFSGKLKLNPKGWVAGRRVVARCGSGKTQ
jgi:hypothetical protein